VGIFDRLFHTEVPAPASQTVAAPESSPPPRLQTINGRDESSLPANAVLLGSQGRIDVRGESYYQVALNQVCGGKSPEGHSRKVLAILKHDPTNINDSNAVEIHVDGLMVGFMGRQAAAQYRPIADLLTQKGKIGAARAYIAGGWQKGADEGLYGITLELSSTEALMETRKIRGLLWQLPPAGSC
jgi:hypothetical protein